MFAVMAAMGFANASRRNNAHDFVLTRLAAELDGLVEPPLVQDTDRLSSHDDPAPSLYCEFRFVDPGLRDSFYADLVGQLSGAQGPVIGSWIAKHDCGNYQRPPVPCVETERQVF